MVTEIHSSLNQSEGSDTERVLFLRAGKVCALLARYCAVCNECITMRQDLMCVMDNACDRVFLTMSEETCKWYLRASYMTAQKHLIAAHDCIKAIKL